MPKITLRIKLLMLSIAMLSIPYVGFQYLRETERYLQSALEESLLAVAGALAVSLQGESTLFRNSLQRDEVAYPLFVHALRQPIQIDGYTDDWTGYLQWFDRFDAVPNQGDAPNSDPLSFELVVGEHGQYLNLLVRVQDSSYVYQDAGAFDPAKADALELIVLGDSDTEQRIFLSSAGPGPVTAYAVAENWDYSTTRQPVANVVGEWREIDDGYAIEIRLPLFLANRSLAVVVHDSDNGFATNRQVTSTTDRDVVVPNQLLRSSTQLRDVLTLIGQKKGRRVWVINRNGQVLASDGSLVSEAKRGAINVLYTWILPRANDTFVDELKSASRLRSEEVQAALAGEAATRWRSSPDERALIVSAAQPVRSDNQLVGAVVVEETTNSIQTVQREAMAGLFNKSIFVFIGVSGILLIFASRLSSRIRRLRDQSEQAIDVHGRVVGAISSNSSSDELGDLSRSVSAMLERLGDYNAYLESMASKLSHELRTPLTVVSSSLENLDESDSVEDQKRYLARAREGMSRLHGLVSRLSEASRLEQSIANVEFEEFDLSTLLRGCVDGYRGVYPNNDFALSGADQDCPYRGSGDLIAQLLDKLIDNAVTFGADDKTIEITLNKLINKVVISVINRGSSLPAEMRKQIFNSMVSVREPHSSIEPHLGLGLFIARLIAEMHGGDISAENLIDGSGVAFTLEIPRDVGS